MSAKRENAIGVIYLFFTAACWSFVGVAVKQLTTTVDPYTISFYRVFLATIVLVLIFVAQKGDWRRLRWLAPLIIVGALGRAGNYLLYNAGLDYTPSSAATILAPAQQIGVLLLAWWFLRERIAAKWLGLALSFAGLILIFWNGQSWAALADTQYAWGYFLLVIAGFATAVQFTTQKMLSSTHSAAEILLPVFVLATVMTLPFAWTAGGFSRSYDPWTWALLLILGLIFTGLAFFALGEGYKRCDSSTGVVIINTGVFFTLFWSHFLLNEQIGSAMIVGAALGLAGAVAVIQADRRQLDRVEMPTERVKLVPDFSATDGHG